MNDNLTKMLSKVAALRALAARATTQAEAEAAAAQAAAICAKYQIDEANIPASSSDRDEAIGQESVPQGKRAERWAGALFCGLAKDHGCVGYQGHGDLVPGSGRHDGGVEFKLAGRPSDIAIVKHLFAWLSVEIARLAVRENGRADRNSFRIGCVIGVLAAMRAARKTEVAHATQSAALVLVNRESVALAWLRTTDVRLRSGSGRVKSNDALERGKAAGGSLSTGGRALGSGGGPLRLGK